MQEKIEARETIRIHSLHSYTFGIQEKEATKAQEPQEKLESLKQEYEQNGQRTLVETVIIVHDHMHPHILLLNEGPFYKLPGEYLKPGQQDAEGLQINLDKLMGETAKVEVQGQLIASWIRPNFDIHMYPYTPPHITSPKELKQVYICVIQC